MNNQDTLFTVDQYMKQFGLDKLPLLNAPAILVFNKDMFEQLKALSSEENKPNKQSIMDFFNLRLTNRSIRVFLSGDGSVSAAFTLALLARRGITGIIGIGYSVSLVPDELKIGDYFLPYSSIRYDGASQCYLSKEIPVVVNPLTLARVYSIITRKNVTHFGLSYCTDSYFHLKRDDVRGKNVMSLDMESGAFLTVTEINSIPSVLINIIAEEINHNGEWKVDYPKARNSLKQLTEMLPEILTNIVRQTHE